MDSSSVLIFGIWLCWIWTTSGHPVDKELDAHTHTLDQFVEPHVSVDQDFAQDEQLRTKRKNCPQMALFLAFNGDKNCKKPVYHNFHTIELNGDSSNEEPNDDLNHPAIQHSISDIDNAQSLDENIGNYLMDRLFESGDIVPNNVTKEVKHSSGIEEPKDENKIDHKYEELMSAMHLVLEKMKASKENKQPGQLDQHTDANEYGSDPDVPQTVTDDYGPIIELSKLKSEISKNRNKFRSELGKPANTPQTVTDEYGPIIELPKSKPSISRKRNNFHTELHKPAKNPQTVTDEYGPIIELPQSRPSISRNRNIFHTELDKPAKKPSKIGCSVTTSAELETVQPIAEDEPDEEDHIYEEDPIDWDFPVFKNLMELHNNRELGNIINDRMTHTQIQDQLKKYLGINCECTKHRDCPPEGKDITLIPQTPYHPTNRYKRPRSDGNRRNFSCSHDSYSDGRPKKLKRPNRRTKLPSRNHWNANSFDSSDKYEDREDYIQKKSIPFASEIIPGRQRGSKRKETNSIPLAPVDEEWPEENVDDFLEKFSRISNIKSKEESKSKLRSKSQASEVSRKEEDDDLKMDLAQKLAQLFLLAKRKTAKNRERPIKSAVPSKSNIRRSKPCDCAKTESLSISDLNEKEFLRELFNALTDDIPEDTYKGPTEDEEDEDEVTSPPNLSFNRNRSKLQHFAKPNIAHLARNDYTDDDESIDDDDTELQSRGNYRPSVRPTGPKVEEAYCADEDENDFSDVGAIENFNDAQSYVPKTRTRGLLRPNAALHNQRRTSSIEVDEEDIEFSGDGMEKDAVNARKLYRSQHLKPTIPRNNRIQTPYEREVGDTEKTVLKRTNSRGSRVHSPSPRPQSKRVLPNYRQQQNRPKPRPRLASEPSKSLDDYNLKNEYNIPASMQKIRKSYEYNPKTLEKRPKQPQRRIDELPEDLDENENDFDDDGDEIIDLECLKHPSNIINNRKPRPLPGKIQQRLSSGEVKGSTELHILINDPTTEPCDKNAAIEDTKEDQPLQADELKYFRDHRTIRRQGRTMESEGSSHAGNRRNGRNQSDRGGTNANTKSQRPENDRRRAIVHREERGLFDRKRLQLLGSLSDSKESRDSNNGKAISDHVITPKTDFEIDTHDLPVHSNIMFANGLKLSSVDPKYMDDQFLIYPELINDEMEFNPLEPSQELVKNQIPKKTVAKVEKKIKGRLENQQQNQTVTSDDEPTTTINHPQARRYLNLFYNFKERVSAATKKPAHAKYYRGYPPGVQKYAANYS